MRNICKISKHVKQHKAIIRELYFIGNLVKTDMKVLILINTESTVRI